MKVSLVKKRLISHKDLNLVVRIKKSKIRVTKSDFEGLILFNNFHFFQSKKKYFFLSNDDLSIFRLFMCHLMYWMLFRVGLASVHVARMNQMAFLGFFSKGDGKVLVWFFLFERKVLEILKLITGWLETILDF